MTDLLNAALDYARRGLKVFPIHGIVDGVCTCDDPKCEKPGKHPVVRRGFQVASSDERQVREWWTKHPNANIGARTGRVGGFFVIDEDAPGACDGMFPDGAESVCEAITRTGREGGGFHYGFRVNGEAIKSGPLAGFPGVDAKADGGYVILPPSMHETGRRYSWHVEPEGASLLDALTNAPESVREAISGSAYKPRPKPVPAAQVAVESHGAAYGVTALRAECDAVARTPEGGRNERLNAAAFRAGQLLAAGDVSETQALDALSRAADACGLSEKEATDVIERGVRDGYAKPRTVSVVDEPDEDEPTILYHLTAPTIRSMVFPDADWLVQHFILRDSVTVIHAPPKEGKSTLLYSLVGKLAQGDAEWAGFRLVGKPCKILYLSESSARIVRAHVIKHDLGVNVIFAPNEERSALLNAEQVLEGVAQLVEMYEPDMLVIDTMTSWGRIVGERENDSVVMQRVADAYRRFATSGCAVVIVHHSNKGGDLSPVQSLRGSSATAGAVDCLTRIYDPTNGNGGTRRKVWTLGRMDEQNWQRWIDWDDAARTFHRAEEPNGDEDRLSDAELERVALSALTSLLKAAPATARFGYRRIIDRAKRDRPDLSFGREDVQHALDRMRKASPPLVTHTTKGYALAPPPEHETPPLAGAVL